MERTKIAIPVDDGRLSPHFGHASAFEIYITEDGRIVSKESLSPPPHEPGAVPKWLHALSVDVIIAGGMGAMAQELFKKFNIGIVSGSAGAAAADLVASYLRGDLTSPLAACTHDHGGHEHGHGHSHSHSCGR